MSVNLLTITAVRNREDVWGRTRTNLFDVTLSAGYPTGGYTFSPHRVGLSTLQGVVLEGGNIASAAWTPLLDITTGKLVIVDVYNAVEETDNVNLSAATMRIRVEGE